MTENEMPPMASLVPLIDRLREIADEEIPHPQTLETRVWEDGDYQIRIFHNGPAKEQIMYKPEMENPVWQRLKGRSEGFTEDASEYGEILELDYEEREERQIEW
ncbi:hypothetical protein SAMN04488065_1260 [Haloplanus vescus]|uniref:Uncharacterized protein n=1 Tax=Haloplanus vescus TaxID=555874 RepID=A0A1H3X0Y3_9EURY|nr:hypothetical protein [Haloplanus vescus]SDZ92631.1 hypothetical protein SAMN04488065_1260 [Haloplanus vescus]